MNDETVSSNDPIVVKEKLNETRRICEKHKVKAYTISKHVKGVSVSTIKRYLNNDVSSPKAESVEKIYLFVTRNYESSALTYDTPLGGKSIEEIAGDIYENIETYELNPIFKMLCTYMANRATISEERSAIEDLLNEVKLIKKEREKGS